MVKNSEISLAIFLLNHLKIMRLCTQKCISLELETWAVRLTFTGTSELKRGNATFKIEHSVICSLYYFNIQIQLGEIQRLLMIMLAKK